MGSGAPPVLVSIVVPMFNEEDSVGPLHDRLRPVMDAGPWAFEVVLVDDGSADGTFAAMRRLHEADPRVRCVKFRRIYGQSPAMKAGFDDARIVRAQETLKKGATEYLSLKSSFDKLTTDANQAREQLTEVQQGYEKLKSSTSIHWFLSGAGVLVLGWLLGLVMARTRRRRVSEFYR